MKRTTVLRWLQFLCALALVAAGWTLVFGRPPTEELRPPAIPVVAPRVAPPARVRVARLGIDAPIVPTGLTPDGRMEVPADTGTVGWFAPGTVPGESGSAVLSGHLDTVLGTDAVFARLKELIPGDEILIDTRSGATLAFVVRRTESYPYDASPIQEIFGGTGGTLLNLITCDGRWLRHTYDRRMVVYSSLKEEGEE